VTANVTYTATWSQQMLTVTFVDWNGTVLKTEQVAYGGSATPPASPTREGYTFRGWDRPYTNITTNTEVRALYDQIPDETPVDDVIIPPQPPPLDPGAWALVNLILTILGGLLSLIIFFAFFFGRKKEEEEENENKYENGESTAKRKRLVWRVLSLVLFIVAVIVFILTEDMRLPMTWVDFWTILHAIIFVFQIVFSIIASIRKKKTTESSEGTYAQMPAKQ
jgi:hypothetical protein